MKYKTIFEGVRERRNIGKTDKKRSINEIANFKDAAKCTVIFEDENGNKEEVHIKKAIARLTYLYSVKMLNSSDSNRLRYNTAVLLLNQAQIIADSDSAMALKLYNQARKLFRKK
jgi:hypothetical protein